MELRRKSVNEHSKLRDSDGEEDAGEYKMPYKLIGKHWILMKTLKM